MASESKNKAGEAARDAAESQTSPATPADQAAAAGEGAKAAAEQQTQISTSRGFLDFLVTNRLSIALTSYQTGQLMLIGPFLDGRLSIFQRNFVRAMGICVSPERLYLAAMAQIWRFENVLAPGQLATQKS